MRILLASDFDDDLRPRPGASWWAQRVFWFAQPGDVVLFSPGTSSFDMFKNYAERGNLFRTLVQGLEETPPS